MGELFALLSHPHRRRIFTELNESTSRHETEVELEALSDATELEDETVNLIHNHLPRLAEAGFVEWDPERQVVTHGSRFHEIAPLISLMVTHQDELPANWL